MPPYAGSRVRLASFHAPPASPSLGRLALGRRKSRVGSMHVGCARESAAEDEKDKEKEDEEEEEEKKKKKRTTKGAGGRSRSMVDRPWMSGGVHGVTHAPHLAIGREQAAL
ncbi:hypothetical protein KM043_008164 [Ampulex compressa]|nr:hypothetical protein KM043_008164 [Ampulex compressa]